MSKQQPTQPIYIVVGPDGTGKTPFIDNAVKAIPSLIRKQTLTDPKKTTPEEKIVIASKHIMMWEARKFDSYIYDRFPFPDEWIYGPAFGQKETLGWGKDWNIVERAMSQFDIRIILLMPGDVRNYLARMEREPDDKVPTDKLWGIVKRYLDFSGRTILPVTTVHTPHWFDEINVKEILQNCKRGPNASS